MPNASAHKALGAASGAAASSYFVAPFLRPHDENNGKPALLLAGLVAGGVGGRIPDMLEPPIHPNHRGFCHSVVVGGAVVAGVAITVRALHELRGNQTSAGKTTTGSVRRGEDDEEASGVSFKSAVVAAVAIAVLVGIISHLAADSGTPSGLPLLR